MIGRLVELLLRLNPMARDALRLTYSHLFMDEFQDTTQIQYDLVRTIFLGADTVVTAVGDNKQQIMRWAMAMDDPFAAFDAHFKPRRTPLYNNYRSSPELVRIQHILAQALDAKSVRPVSKITGTVSGESCAILDFQSPEREADKLAEIVSAQMKAYELEPRDFTFAAAGILRCSFGRKRPAMRLYCNLHSPPRASRSATSPDRSARSCCRTFSPKRRPHCSSVCYDLQ